MNALLVFPLILMNFFLNAALEDHFKSAKDKSANHSMRNIDFIYVINLDQRPEKWKTTFNQLQSFGIFPYRFSSVNGWELSVKDINDVGLKYEPGMTPLMATVYREETPEKRSREIMTEFGRTYLHLSLGALGCYLSHLSVLQDAYDSNYETIWVLEDDIEVLDDPRKLSDYVDMLDDLLGKDGWDVLFTDQDCRSRTGQYIIAYGACEHPDMDCSVQARTKDDYTLKKNISPYFRQISARFGAYSMIIRRSGIIKLLEFSKKHLIYQPYDLENYLMPDIRRFSLRYDLVTNMLNALTDNEKPNYKQESQQNNDLHRE